MTCVCNLPSACESTQYQTIITCDDKSIRHSFARRLSPGGRKDARRASQPDHMADGRAMDAELCNRLQSKRLSACAASDARNLRTAWSWLLGCSHRQQTNNKATDQGNVSLVRRHSSYRSCTLVRSSGELHCHRGGGNGRNFTRYPACHSFRAKETDM